MALAFTSALVVDLVRRTGDDELHVTENEEAEKC